jgi:hypothetical protein
MRSVETIFAALVGVLAALAVVGALVAALVWEWCAIRRTLAAHRQAGTRPPTDEDFWRQQRALNGPR